MKKALLIVAALMAVLIVLLGATFGLLLSVARNSCEPWPELLADVRIAPLLPVLDAYGVSEDNGAFYILKLGDAVSGPLPDAYDRFEESRLANGPIPEMDAYLAANGELFELIRAAAACERGQVPTVASADDIIDYLSPIRNATRLLVYRGEVAAAAGDWDTMLTSYRHGFRLADQVSTGGPLINALVSFACRSILCEGMRATAASCAVPVGVLRQEVDLLREVREERFPFGETMRFEYLCMLEYIEMIYDDPQQFANISGEEVAALRHGGPFLRLLGSRKTQTLAHFEAVYSHMIDSADGPYAPERYRAELGPFVSGFMGSGSRWGALVDDPIGRVMVSMLLPATDTVAARWFKDEAILACTESVLAIRAFAADHDGDFPKTLASLVPLYLDAVPRDPFAKPPSDLLFRSAGGIWTVYSVGADQVDNGGMFSSVASFDERCAHEGELDIPFSNGEFADMAPAAVPSEQP